MFLPQPPGTPGLVCQRVLRRARVSPSFTKARRERPRYPSDHDIGYELLPIVDQWWNRIETGEKEKMFDEYFTYQPLGGRPSTRISPIPGSFLGRKEASNKAKPFWGWNDNLTSKKKVLAVGQWGLDPAYAVSRNLQFPATEPFSLNYTFNPYLIIDNNRLSAVLSSDGRVLEPKSSSQPTIRIDPAGNLSSPSPSTFSARTSVLSQQRLQCEIQGRHPQP